MISIVKPEVTLLDHCGNDLSVVNAARVSFYKTSDFDNGELRNGDVKLIQYLAKHEHTSPFNHAFISIRVKTSLAMARQFVKHSYLPWNEVSRRYVSIAPEFYEPIWREKADNVKQGSAGEILDTPRLAEISTVFWLSIEEAYQAYNRLLDLGVCPEQARFVLPLNTMTEWVWSGTLYAWSRMCNLRLGEHAQQEAREIAEEVSKIIQPLFPVSWKALTND